jgi:hypothetical protein
MKILYFLGALLLLISCEKEQTASVYKNDVNTAFELTTGEGWKFVGQQGIDSYVGYYFRTPDTIRFDCGMYGFAHIDSIQEEPGSIHFEETEMNGSPGKISGTQVGDDYSWTAYIQYETDTLMQNVLRIKNPSNDQEIITIFKSHKFK